MDEHETEKKAANRERGDSMNPEERVVEDEARRESWVKKVRRTLRLSRAKPDPARKDTPR